MNLRHIKEYLIEYYTSEGKVDKNDIVINGIDMEQHTFDIQIGYCWTTLKFNTQLERMIKLEQLI